MELFQAIGDRFSYRGRFSGESVPREDLKKIVQAGLDAPSGRNQQTTSFVILDDPGLLGQIRRTAAGVVALETAPALICCIVDKHPGAVYHGHSFQIEDCAAAVENMLLAITALGYASVWLDGMLRIETRSEKISGILRLPEGKKVQVMLPVGVPAEDYPRKEKKPFEERAGFNGWPRG
ncbi:MAG TPA: nitroreductase [bacterium]|nr:nitroreductase [bacterium]